MCQGNLATCWQGQPLDQGPGHITATAFSLLGQKEALRRRPGQSAQQEGHGSPGRLCIFLQFKFFGETVCPVNFTFLNPMERIKVLIAVLVRSWQAGIWGSSQSAARWQRLPCKSGVFSLSARVKNVGIYYLTFGTYCWNLKLVCVKKNDTLKICLHSISSSELTLAWPKLLI